MKKKTKSNNHYCGSSIGISYCCTQTNTSGIGFFFHRGGQTLRLISNAHAHIFNTAVNDDDGV